MPVCKECGTTFPGHGSKKFCKPECYITHYSEKSPVINQYTGDNCIEWIGGINKDGYGNCAPHRVAYETWNGVIPSDKPQILHKCHNRKCVNPKHLRCGTVHDNMADKNLTKSKPTTLTEKEAVMIKYHHKDLSGPKVAELYNVTNQTVYNIRNGKYWSHI